MAPGVQTALQTSPQPPHSRPPPGGPSGKLERDSVCRRPWGGSGRGGGQRSHAPFPGASWANPRGRGQEGAALHSRGPQRARGHDGLVRTSFWAPPTERHNSRTTQGPGEHGRVRLPNLHFPLLRRPDESLQNPPNLMTSLQPMAPTQLCAPLAIPQGEKKKKKEKILLAPFRYAPALVTGPLL